jgi:glycosyltransferase involved in cell wall biosynthesis
MLVSIILPTFNRGYCLRRAINSVLAQSYSDWELIVVDDGSTDNTASLLTHLTDPRIRVFRHPVNKGVAAARNTGLSAARGQWIAFIDSDDTWHPDKLATQLAIVRQEPRVSVLFSDLIWRRNGVEVFSFVRTLPVFSQLVLNLYTRNYVIIPRRTMYLILLQELPVKPSTLLIHSQAVIHSGSFQERLVSGEDWEFLLRVARYYDFVYVDRPLVELHVLCDATHVRYFTEDKQSFIALLRREQALSRADAEACAAARRGIIGLRKHLYWHYMAANAWQEAASSCLMGFQETNDFGLLLRAAWAVRAGLFRAVARRFRRTISLAGVPQSRSEFRRDRADSENIAKGN